MTAAVCWWGGGGGRSEQGALAVRTTKYGGGYGADMRRGGEMSELDLKLSATQDWRSRSLRGF